MVRFGHFRSTTKCSARLPCLSWRPRTRPGNLRKLHAETDDKSELSALIVDDEIEVPTREMRSLLGQAAVTLDIKRQPDHSFVDSFERHVHTEQQLTAFLERSIKAGLVHIKAGLVGLGKEKLGTMEAHLIDRDTWRGNFHAVCEYHSLEVLHFAVDGFNVDGTIQPAIACKARDAKTASFGRVLYISRVELEEHLRGHDLGIFFIDAVMRHFRYKFTIAGLRAWPWSDADMSPESVLNGRSESEREDLEEVQQRQLKLARQFSRLGFNQIGHTEYMFMEPSTLPFKFAPLSKDDPAIPEFKVAPIVTVEERDALSLHWVVGQCEAADVQRELARGGQDVNAADSWGNTALHVAAVRCKPDIVRILVEAGADPLAALWDGNTPLMMLRQKARCEKLAAWNLPDCLRGHLKHPWAKDAADARKCEALLIAAEAGAAKRTGNMERKPAATMHAPIESGRGEGAKVPRPRFGVVVHQHRWPLGWRSLERTDLDEVSSVL